MCGVAGIVSRDGSAPVSENRLLAMQESLVHRGPDDHGMLLGPGVGLVSTRLAVLDLSSRGHMPMATADRRYQIAYNGEIYNYRELRRELEAKGCALRSRTDTEVLLNLYAHEGVGMLQRLNGMFAFAMWDGYERTLLLARDRMGIKPLYYARHANTLVFASEQKAIFAAGIDAVMDLEAWDELLCHRFVAGERTPFHGIRRLLPGHYLTWRDGELRTRRWWHLAERVHALREELPSHRQGRRQSEVVDWYREVFDEAVDVRRLSDVPVGVLLSGGLDSSSVATSLARSAGGQLASFTVRFAEGARDEGPFAQEVARASGLVAHELTLTPAEAAARLHDATALNDEPLAHSSDVHLWAIAEYAKAHVTVLLSGEGADETLGGYVRYQPLRYAGWLSVARQTLPRLNGSGHLPPRFGKLARLLALGSNRRFLLFDACDVLPPELDAIGHRSTCDFAYRQSLLDEAEALYPNDLVRQAMYTDQHTFLASLLHRNDRMTMGASIECRVPFLDYRLVERLAALPSSLLLPGLRSKPLLRQALGHRLPAVVRRAPKWGFGVPWSQYMRTVAPLREEVARLPKVDPLRDGPFRPLLLRRVVQQFLEGNTAHERLVAQLLMIAVWYRACVAQRRPVGRQAVSGFALRERAQETLRQANAFNHP